MTENKTRRTGNSVREFLATVDNEKRRKDCQVVMQLMREVTGKRAAMWGPGIIGFGSYHYKYDSGREGDMPLTGVSPRKQNLSIYIMAGFDRYEGLMKKLGRHKTGKSCLYISNLDDVDLNVLRRLIKESTRDIGKRYAG